MSLAPLTSNAQTITLEDLFEQLRQPDQTEWKTIEDQIWQHWSRSGSDSMDLLLQRGRDAMEQGRLRDAIGHFTALIDHAPEFAEGWNARATAFYLMEEYGLSVSDIEVTLALNPRHFGALSGLGMILEKIDRPEDALKTFRQLVEIHPYRPDVNEAIERLQAAIGGTAL